MRPLNVMRDLPAVADLIELCFSATLDPEGRSYIDNMRRNGRDRRFLNWAPRMIETVSLPLSGFVWEDHGKVVGNVSLVPFSRHGQKVYLIANVATHPDYRRQGIARMLTEAAIRATRDKHAAAIWLHVRSDNPGAISLYRQLGFLEHSRRTSWHASLGTTPLGNIRTPVASIPRATRDWEAQQNWLSTSYPAEIEWYFTHHWDIFRPGLWNSMYRFFTDTSTLQWSAYRYGSLLGVLASQRVNVRHDRLWLAIPREPDLDAVTILLLHGRRMLSQSSNLSLEYPAGRTDEAIRSAGFIPQRTLVWMYYPGLQLS